MKKLSNINLWLRVALFYHMLLLSANPVTAEWKESVIVAELEDSSSYEDIRSAITDQEIKVHSLLSTYTWVNTIHQTTLSYPDWGVAAKTDIPFDDIPNSSKPGDYNDVIDYQVGADGTVYVLYLKYLSTIGVSQTWYGTNRSGHWQAEVLIPDNSVDELNFDRMSIDQQGNAHILLNNAQQVVYATNHTGSWKIETILGTEKRRWYSLSMAIDHNGYAHIGYQALRPYLGSLIKYTSNRTGRWESEVASRLTAAESSESLMIVVNDQGTVAHIVYGVHNNKKDIYSLVYTTGTNKKWEKSVLDTPYATEVDSANYLRLAGVFSQEDTLHVVYNRDTALIHTSKKANEDWVTQVLHTDKYVQGKNQIALDKQHRVHYFYIGYVNDTKQPPAKAGGLSLWTGSPDTHRLNDASMVAPS